MIVEVRHFPQLRLLCWSRPEDAVLDGVSALALYERNWRFVDLDVMTVDEQVLLDQLIAEYGGGCFLAA